MKRNPKLNKRMEEKFEVQTYLDKLSYAIDTESGKIVFQKKRKSDEVRKRRHTNRFTISHLFPDEDDITVLKRELTLLTVENYIETVTDLRFPNHSELRVFGKKYCDGDVYIKIRVELLSDIYNTGDSFIMILSFHFTEFPFNKGDFPYRK